MVVEGFGECYLQLIEIYGYNFVFVSFMIVVLEEVCFNGDVEVYCCFEFYDDFFCQLIGQCL